MKKLRTRRPSPATVIAVVAVTIAMGGIAFATIPDSSGTIHGCYSKANGNLRVVESESDCRSNERSISWNQRGPTGPTGPAGGVGDGQVARFFSVRGSTPYGEEAAVARVPGLFEVRLRCDERVDEQPGEDLKTLIWTIENLSQGQLTQNGPISATLAAGAAVTEHVTTQAPASPDDYILFDFETYGPGDAFAEGTIQLFIHEDSCVFRSHPISNVTQ